MLCTQCAAHACGVSAYPKSRVFAHVSEIIALRRFVSTDMASIEFHTCKNSASGDLKLTQWSIQLSGFPVRILPCWQPVWGVWLVYLVIRSRWIVCVCLISLLCSIVGSSCYSNICSCYQMCSLLLCKQRSHLKDCMLTLSQRSDIFNVNVSRKQTKINAMISSLRFNMNCEICIYIGLQQNFAYPD